MGGTWVPPAPFIGEDWLYLVGLGLAVGLAVGEALALGVADAVAAGTGPEAPAAEPAWPK